MFKRELICNNNKCPECNIFLEDEGKNTLFKRIDNGYESNKLHPRIKEKWEKENKEIAILLKKLEDNYKEKENLMDKIDDLLNSQEEDEDLPLCQRMFGYTETNEVGIRQKLWDNHMKLLRRYEKC